VASRSGVDEDMGSPLTTPTTDENDSEEDGKVSMKVPKPTGTVGRPQSGGYNLQDKLGWNDTTYQSILVSFVKRVAKHSEKLIESGPQTGKDKVRHCKSFRGQDMSKIKQLCDSVSFPIVSFKCKDLPSLLRSEKNIPS
jgi:hypothetical protein